MLLKRRKTTRRNLVQFCFTLLLLLGNKSTALPGDIPISFGRQQCSTSHVVVARVAFFKSLPRRGYSRTRYQTLRCAELDDSQEQIDPLQAALRRGQEQDFENFVRTQVPTWLRPSGSLYSTADTARPSSQSAAQSASSSALLPFSCTECGKCCQTKGTVAMTKEEAKDAASYLNLTLSDFIELYGASKHSGEDPSSESEGWVVRLKEIEAHSVDGEATSSACIFLDPSTNHCRIYEVRPTQCRTYPFWPSILASPQRWNDECRRPDHDDEASDLPRWSYENGGCEGMKPLQIEADSSILGSFSPIDGEGVPLDQALRQLYDQVQAIRRFPKSKPADSDHDAAD